MRNRKTMRRMRSTTQDVRRYEEEDEEVDHEENEDMMP